MSSPLVCPPPEINASGQATGVSAVQPCEPVVQGGVRSWTPPPAVPGDPKLPLAESWPLSERYENEWFEIGMSVTGPNDTPLHDTFPKLAAVKSRVLPSFDTSRVTVAGCEVLVEIVPVYVAPATWS